MIFQSDFWKVTRCIGIGDYEHVRNGVLSILFPSKHNLEVAVEASYDAAIQLGFRPRVHLNVHHLTPAALDRVIDMTVRRSSFDAQLMEHGKLSFQQFEGIFNTCELVIEPVETKAGTYTDLLQVFTACWKGNGDRFLNGNPARWTYAELKVMYPSLFYDSRPVYEKFSQTRETGV